jgi:hypothetical protein
VFLDQVRFEHEGFDLVVDDDEFKVGDRADESSRLRILVTARLKILSYAAAQVLCLTDIEDLPGGILVKVDAGGNGYTPKFVLQVGHVKNLTLGGGSNQN